MIVLPGEGLDGVLQLVELLGRPPFLRPLGEELGLQGAHLSGRGLVGALHLLQAPLRVLHLELQVVLRLLQPGHVGLQALVLVLQAVLLQEQLVGLLLALGDLQVQLGHLLLQGGDLRVGGGDLGLGLGLLLLLRLQERLLVGEGCLGLLYLGLQPLHLLQQLGLLFLALLERFLQ